MRWNKVNSWILAGVLSALSMSGCATRDVFTARSSSQAFVQSYNPETLDILWVIDDRSPMFKIRDSLAAEATKFFQRLEASTGDYQMGFVSMDNQSHHGDLKPYGSPYQFTKKFGTIPERVNFFTNVNFPNVVNLNTGSQNQGLEVARLVLNSPTSAFHVRAGVPLVLIFVSDSEDMSVGQGTNNVIDFYEAAYSQVKGGNKDLIRVYSVNYLVNGSTCATINDTSFERRFSLLAKRFSSASTNVNGDLCGSFADMIDLSGIRLKVLSPRFKLEVPVQPQSIRVSVTRNGGQEVFNLSWHYDANTQEIVFDETPPEGVTILVNYLPA